MDEPITERGKTTAARLAAMKTDAVCPVCGVGGDLVWFGALDRYAHPLCVLKARVRWHKENTP